MQRFYKINKKNEKYIFNIKIDFFNGRFIRSHLSFGDLWNCTICPK
ncbi:hypothetical protein NO098_40103 [Flavobacterium psychrophilum]|nr:hypothetical protein FI146_250015 [Flavobacterium psychrophilum]SNB37864.1 hypothetical protein NO098_40103 [Flavobacterium psychrophilum]